MVTSEKNNSQYKAFV